MIPMSLGINVFPAVHNLPALISLPSSPHSCHTGLLTVPLTTKQSLIAEPQAYPAPTAWNTLSQIPTHSPHPPPPSGLCLNYVTSLVRLLLLAFYLKSPHPLGRLGGPAG